MNVPLNLVPDKKRINFKGDRLQMFFALRTRIVGSTEFELMTSTILVRANAFMITNPVITANDFNLHLRYEEVYGDVLQNNKIGKDILKVSMREYWRKN